VITFAFTHQNKEVTKKGFLMEEIEKIIIKQYPEDFLVIEKIAGNKIKEFRSNKLGRFCIFTLKKRGVDMLSAIRALSNIYNVREKAFSYSGTKDKNAVTIQYCSVFGRIYDKKVSFGDSGDFIEVKVIGFSKSPISLGDHLGNEFVINVRNISDQKYFELTKQYELEKDAKHSERPNIDRPFIPNYFDSQRFGILCNNHFIGKLIVLSKFEDATNLIKEQMGGKISLKLAKLSGLEFLKALNSKQAMMYIHSYQSFIFNNAVSSFIEDNFDCFKLNYSFGKLAFPKKSNNNFSKLYKNMKVNLAGFGFESDGKINKYVLEEMKKERVKDRDFIIRQIPMLSAESQKRNFLVKLKYLSIKTIHPKNEIIQVLDDKRKIKSTTQIAKDNVLEVKFTLGKGNYATIVIATLFSQRPTVL
jgi:tRNA pseudouridine13 synthase